MEQQVPPYSSRQPVRPMGTTSKDLRVNQATKLLRTYVAQMEALNKYRRGGEQKMVVEQT
jgi:hypothetical protein